MKTQAIIAGPAPGHMFAPAILEAAYHHHRSLALAAYLAQEKVNLPSKHDFIAQDIAAALKLLYDKTPKGPTE